VAIVVADTALNIGATSPVTFTFSEAVTGFTNGDLTIANGTLTPVTSSDGGITWTATLTPTAAITDATNVITLATGSVFDLASNANSGATDSNNYAIDTVRPTVAVNIVDTALNDGNPDSLVTFTFSEAVLGFDAGDLTPVGGALTAFTMVDAANYTATFTATKGFEGTGTVTVAAGSYTDLALNTGAAGFDTVPIDRNHVPVANGDIVLTNIAVDTGILIPAAALLANDTDSDNNPLSILIVANPATNDTAAITFGNVLYTDKLPQDGFFDYKAFDGTALSGFAHVIVDTQTGTTVTGALGALDEILIGSPGNDTLNGGAGNDFLYGGLGNDSYLINRGDGQDTISENDGTVGNTDTLLYGASINPMDLVLSRQVNDLRLAIHGATDMVTIQYWYSAPTTAQVETIQAGNGQTLLSTQVDQLIQAMAGFTQQTGLTWDQGIVQRPQEVQTVLAANWH
jgi:hypothetical protein